MQKLNKQTSKQKQELIHDTQLKTVQNRQESKASWERGGQGTLNS